MGVLCGRRADSFPEGHSCTKCLFDDNLGVSLSLCCCKHFILGLFNYLNLESSDDDVGFRYMPLS